MAAVANSLASGNGFGSPYVVASGPTALVPPVYPYLLSIFFRIFGSQSEMAGLAALGLNVILSALVLIPLYVLTERLFNRRAARIAVWVWALLPLSGYTDALFIWNTSLFTLLLTTVLAFTTSLSDGQISGAKLTLYALLTGFTILLEPVGAVVVMISFGWLVYVRFPIKKMVQIVVVAALLPCVWSVRNFMVFHQVVFIRSGLGLELSRGVSEPEPADGRPDSLPNRNPAELEKYLQMGEIPYMQFRFDRAVHWITENPVEYGERIGERFVAYWTGYQVSKIYYFYDKFELVKRLFFALPALGVILALFFLKKKYVLLIYPILVFYPAIYFVTHVELRYRLPLEPTLYCLMIGSALAVLEPRLRRVRTWLTNRLGSVERDFPTNRNLRAS